jgi:2-amino-4-hydroxy-6-hydroxymethyldihydropteridine diphosphokinase
MRAVLILGSNIGNRPGNIRRARDLIGFLIGRILKQTDVIETKPFGFARQPYFLNCGFLVDTSHPPFLLLKLVKYVEKRVGRYRTFHWGPRVIDIDIVTYGNLRIDTKNLKIPHPGLKDRDFFRDIYSELIS